MEPETVCCFSIATGMSAISQQAILLLNDRKVTILFINKLTSTIVKKVEFVNCEISNSSLKRWFLFEERWNFTAGQKNWAFKIQLQILPIRPMQKEFLRCLRESSYVVLKEVI